MAMRALAALRAFDPELVFLTAWVGLYCPNHVPPLPLRPSGLRPLPLVVLWAMANQEPPVFLMARSACVLKPRPLTCFG